MREAHPLDGKAPSTFGLVEDPITDVERLEVAGRCHDELDLPMPILVDRVDDKVSRAYGGWPDRLYLIGKDGKVAYAGAQGPKGFEPEPWAEAIESEKAKLAAKPAGGEPTPTKPSSKPPAGKAPNPEK